MLNSLHYSYDETGNLRAIKFEKWMGSMDKITHQIGWNRPDVHRGPYKILIL